MATIGVSASGGTGENGAAILSPGVIQVTNAGTLRGDVIGADTSTLVNAQGGVFEPGETSIEILNSGLLSPGGLNSIMTTQSPGFAQDGTGSLAMDLDFQNGRSDRLVVTDANASVAGTVAPHLVTLTSASPLTVLSGAAASQPLAVQDTAAVHYGLTQQGGDVKVGIENVNFNVAGLTSS